MADFLRWLRRMKKMTRQITAKPATPPTAPPTMAAVLDFFAGAGVGLGEGMGAGVGDVWPLEPLLLVLVDELVGVEVVVEPPEPPPNVSV